MRTEALLVAVGENDGMARRDWRASPVALQRMACGSDMDLRARGGGSPPAGAKWAPASGRYPSVRQRGTAWSARCAVVSAMRRAPQAGPTKRAEDRTPDVAGAQRPGSLARRGAGPRLRGVPMAPLTVGPPSPAALAARAAHPYTSRPASPSCRERTPVMAATAERIHALPAHARLGVADARVRRCRR